MDKKCAIITIYGENNYGNRLQNYAVTKVLNSLGYVAQTVVPIEKVCLKAVIKRYIKRIIPIVLGPVAKKGFCALVRENNFREFTKTNIPTRYIKKASLKAVENDYDLFVVGSDQVWNPCFGNFEKYFDDMLLVNVPSHKKCCFSPSFGVSSLPKKWEKRFAQALYDFPKLCVREKDGVHIINKLIGVEPQVCIDPTLMLDAEEWLAVSKKANVGEEPFVLDYFLGETPQEHKLYNEVAKGNRRIKLLNKQDVSVYVSGPAEFVDLISKATVVCTDSFHACVFSILFSKPFVVFPRKDSNKDMLSRIETLLEMFDIDPVSNIGKLIKVDEKIRDGVLKKERQRVVDFLSQN